jgi:hypothetical protein
MQEEPSMKGWLVQLTDDLPETSGCRLLFRADGEECNIHFSVEYFFKEFQINTKDGGGTHYILHEVFSTLLISQCIRNKFQDGSGFSNSECMVLQQRTSLIVRPRDTQSLNLLNTFTSSKAVFIASKETLPNYTSMWGWDQIKLHPILHLASGQHLNSN